MQETNASAPKPDKTPKWELMVSDPDERKVFEALSDPNWDFRTVAGISKSTGVSETEIKRILVKHGKLVRKSFVPDPQRRDLYTLGTRRVKGRELLGWARALISKDVG